MTYRKKPIEVEAVRYEGGVIHPIDGWVKNAFDSEVLWWDSWMMLYVRTLEGYMHVSDGDYIIKGIDGELYPCKPDIFEKTYESADTEARRVNVEDVIKLFEKAWDRMIDKYGHPIGGVRFRGEFLHGLREMEA